MKKLVGFHSEFQSWKFQMAEVIWPVRPASRFTPVRMKQEIFLARDPRPVARGCLPSWERRWNIGAWIGSVGFAVDQAD